MSRICPLFSGSTGNSTYIGSGNTGILIDAGASAKGIGIELERAGVSFLDIDAIAITHCHDDHIKGLKTVLKKTGAKLIATEKTAENLCEKGLVLPTTEIITLNGNSIALKDIEIKNFGTSHDSEGSCGYSVKLSDGKKFTLCTDTGIITDEIIGALMGSDAVLIESNHDIDMLKKGPYPPLLKVRILSDTGHISNAVCAAQVQNLFKNGTTRFILGHLSLNNNTAFLAKSTSESVLMDLGALNGKDYILSVAAPKENGVTVI